VALLALFSLGVVDTINTALRVRKAWRVVHLPTQLGGNVHDVTQWLVDMTPLIRTSFPELTFLTICAAIPAPARSF
jgi:hypothetical protein